MKQQAQKIINLWSMASAFTPCNQIVIHPSSHRSNTSKDHLTIWCRAVTQSLSCRVNRLVSKLPDAHLILLLWNYKWRSSKTSQHLTFILRTHSIYLTRIKLTKWISMSKQINYFDHYAHQNSRYLSNHQKRIRITTGSSTSLYCPTISNGDYAVPRYLWFP